MGQGYETAKKIALKTILILAAVTVIEVLIALTGKGYLIEGVHFPWFLMGTAMIVLSLYKAYLIVGEFMHLKHEVRSMGMSILLPMVLLIWAIIAFLNEGGAWKNKREKVQERNAIETEAETQQPIGDVYTGTTEYLG